MFANVVTESITPSRRTEVFGESTWTPPAPLPGSLPAVDARIFLNEPELVEAGNDHLYTQTGRMYVPTGADVQDGDRFPYRGNQFLVIGDDQIEGVNPLTQSSFGWAKFTIRRD